MNKLRSVAIDSRPAKVDTEQGSITIENLKIRFKLLEDPLKKADIRGRLVKQHRTKPLVTMGDDVLFGELAILKYLQQDGWNGVWVDTYCNCLRSGMPYLKQVPVTLGISGEAEYLYDRLLRKNGEKAAGFFDVFAWRNGDYAFLEYKGRGDELRDSQRKWINVALSCGVTPQQLFFVSYEYVK